MQERIYCILVFNFFRIELQVVHLPLMILWHIENVKHVREKQKYYDEQYNESSYAFDRLSDQMYEESRFFKNPHPVQKSIPDAKSCNSY